MLRNIHGGSSNGRSDGGGTRWTIHSGPVGVEFWGTELHLILVTQIYMNPEILGLAVVAPCLGHAVTCCDDDADEDAGYDDGLAGVGDGIDITDTQGHVADARDGCCYLVVADAVPLVSYQHHCYRQTCSI